MARLARALVVLALLLPAARTSAEELVGTLHLDGLSFISFEGFETLPIPSGGTIRFHFASPTVGSSVSFSIGPGDVVIPPIPLSSGGGTLTYTLASPASGVLALVQGQAQIQLTASVHAALDRPEGGGTLSYTLRFTTETASASNVAGTQTVSVQGARLDLGGRYVQLVGATTNQTQAIPEPGKAVYTVLSGTFDQLPQQAP